MRDEVFNGSVDYIQILDKDGSVDPELEPDLSRETLQDIYYYMVLGRLFDRRAVKLQRRGELGTFPQLEGQEAAQTGSAFAMQDEDWMFPSYREHIVNAVRGEPLEKSLLYWGGDERGSIKGDRNWAETVPIGSQLPQAAGVARGIKTNEADAAVLAYCGDGATSEDDFHSAMTSIGAFSLPVVVLIQNNQYAISVPREEQTGAETLAQKAQGYGFDGIQVDGNDALGVYDVTREALETAREERRPMLVEAVTYRIGNHTTADDATRYRNEDEVAYWRERDPIRRFETYLLETDDRDHGWLEEQLAAAEQESDDVEVVDAATAFLDNDIDIYDLPELLKDPVEQAQADVDAAIEAYRNTDPQDVADLFDYHFAGPLPPYLAAQQDAAVERHGGEA